MTPSFRQREQKIFTGPVHSWRKCPVCPHRQHRGVEDCCRVGAVVEFFGAVEGSASWSALLRGRLACLPFRWAVFVPGAEFPVPGLIASSARIVRTCIYLLSVPTTCRLFSKSVKFNQVFEIKCCESFSVVLVG
jgi:hypothetical protein